MPQLNKGGKFIFGISVIHPDLTIHFPPQVLSEYDAARDPQSVLSVLNLQSGMELLSIRSSDIAFTMGAKGPLLEKAHNFQGDIEKY
ncbi:MAG: hypothetical protein K2K54_09585 [Lachnospiraceae bacterium]|nr:hypothetical protein [Lachnospiraceae bacterium]